MSLGSRIREKREDAGLTQRDIADYFGIKPASVSEWESDKGSPKKARLAPLARLLKTTVNYLLEGTGDFPKEQPYTGEERRKLKRRWDDIADTNVEEARTTGRLPLISWVQAGQWCEIVNHFQPGDAEDWIPCPFNHGPNSFVLKVSGFSMYDPSGEKSYAPGEYIAVDPRAEPLNRKMVVVQLDDEEKATFKQLLVDEDGNMLLKALNPTFTPRTMPMPENSHIVGVVIGKWVPE